MHARTHARTHLVDIGQWLVPLLDQFGGKLSPFLRIHAHHSPQEEDEVRAVVDSLGIEHYLVKLARLCKALDDLQTEGDGTPSHTRGAGDPVVRQLRHMPRRCVCRAID